MTKRFKNSINVHKKLQEATKTGDLQYIFLKSRYIYYYAQV